MMSSMVSWSRAVHFTPSYQAGSLQQPHKQAPLRRGGRLREVKTLAWNHTPTMGLHLLVWTPVSFYPVPWLSLKHKDRYYLGYSISKNSQLSAILHLVMPSLTSVWEMLSSYFSKCLLTAFNTWCFMLHKNPMFNKVCVVPLCKNSP